MALLNTGLAAVDGNTLTAAATAELPPGKLELVAVGKAACAMAAGAISARGADIERALVVTRHGYDRPVAHHQDTDLHIMTAGHPLPDRASLRAGDALLEFVTSGVADRALLVLISGGTSALVERPVPGLTADALAAINRWLLASGKPIAQVNAIRSAISTLKAGRLALHLPYQQTFCYLLSDVIGDDPSTIGSGLLAGAAETELPVDLPPPLPALIRANPIPPPPDHPCFRRITTRVLGSNRTAQAAIRHAARVAKMPVSPPFAPLSGDARLAGEAVAHHLLNAPPGLFLWGGETTLKLPQEPGRGGRCRHLALATAAAIDASVPFCLLAAGTDGEDGSDGVAGGWVDETTVRRAAGLGIVIPSTLDAADSGGLLARLGQELITGPTGTNVMDLVLGYRS